jgi:hypothetical protein
MRSMRLVSVAGPGRGEWDLVADRSGEIDHARQQGGHRDRRLDMPVHADAYHVGLGVGVVAPRHHAKRGPIPGYRGGIRDLGQPGLRTGRGETKVRVAVREDAAERDALIQNIWYTARATTP